MHLRRLEGAAQAEGMCTLVTDPSESKAVRDAELLQRYLDGEEAAFASLVSRYEREMFGFLYRFTGNRAMAEDVFQETFLQLHTSAQAFDMTRRLKPWLFTIAANKARDAMRSRSRRYAMPLDATVAGDDGSATTYVDLMPADIPPPDESLANLETRQAVQDIVRRMPDNLRTVLVLSYFHEFPYKEIAEILDVPLGTVKSRLHSAVRQFADQWKTYAERASHGSDQRQ
jgi:RNA polymerase sigma-70 factor (ECF subfamily)